MSSNKKQNDEFAWVYLESKSRPGKYFYYNKLTKQSSWSPPKKRKPEKTTTTNCEQPNTSIPNPSNQTPKTGSKKKKKKSGNTANKRLANLRKSLTKEGQCPKPAQQEVSINEPGNAVAEQTTDLKKTLTKEKVCPKPPQKNETEKNPRKIARAKRRKLSNNESYKTVCKPINVSVTDSTIKNDEKGENNIQSQASEAENRQKIIKARRYRKRRNVVKKEETETKTICVERDSVISPTVKVAKYVIPKKALPPISNDSETERVIENLRSSQSPAVKTFANDRLSELRSRLSGEVEAKIEKCDVEMENSNIQEDENIEEMEWETIFDEINLIRVKPNCNPVTISVNPTVKENDITNTFYIVVDTNVFINDLQLIKQMLKPSFKGFPNQPMILIPWRVLQELDSLKGNNKKLLSFSARAAGGFLLEELSTNSRLVGQSLREANDHIFPCPLPDDEILNACLQINAKEFTVLLLSNDKILSAKAEINDIKSIDTKAIKGYMYNFGQNDNDIEKINILKNDERDLKIIYYNLKAIATYIISHLLMTVMKQTYGQLWKKILHLPPPWTFVNLVKCILKHWVAAFACKFSEEFQNLLKNLQNTTENDVEKFAFTMCKIIEDENVLNYCPVAVDESKAKLTEVCPDWDKWKSFEENNNKRKEVDCKVTAIFHIIWTFFSKYCAQFASVFNVVHGLDIVADGEPCLDQNNLIRQATNIYNQLVSILSALSNVSQTITAIDVEKLNLILCETVKGLGHANLCTTAEELGEYCGRNRQILQEGIEKFIMLYNILNECQKKC